MTAGPKGIGGWLVLPALSMIISPPMMVYYGHEALAPILDPEVLAALTDPASEYYHPMWNAYIVGSIGVNVALLLATLYVGWHFFRKSARLPKLYIGWLLALVAVHLMDVTTVKLGKLPMFGMSDTELYRDLVRTIISTAIWAPYFLHSERVKNTFVRGAPHVPRVERREPTIGKI